MNAQVGVTPAVADPKGGGEGCAPRPPFRNFFFLQKRSLLAKISIKQVRNLYQNAGNGHFRDSNFQNFLGGGGGHALFCTLPN